jgi:Family of unknown function (DUF6603)
MSEPKKPKKTVLQRVVGFLADVYGWVKETFTDDQARAALLTDLGLPADSTATLDLPKEKLDSLQRYRAATDVDTAAFMQSVDDLKVIFEAVKSFVRAAGVSGEAAIEEYSHRVFQILALNYVRMHQPGLYWAAQPFGFIEESVTTHSTAKAYPERFVSFFKGIGEHFEQLGVGLETEEEAKGLSDLVFLPTAVLVAILQRFLKVSNFAYGWESELGAETAPSEVVSDRIFSFLIPKSLNPKSLEDPSQAEVSCSIVFVPKPHGGPGVLIAFGGGLDVTAPIDDEWTLTFRIRSANAVDFFTRFDEAHVDAGAATDADASFSIATGADEGGLPYVLGIGKRTRLEFGRLALSAELSATGAGVKLTASDSALVISAASDGDQFVAETMPADETRIAFQFGLGLSSNRGLYLEGGAGLQAIVPIGKSIGPLAVQHLQLGLVPTLDDDARKLVLAATAAVAFDLGPVRASLDQIGFRATLDFAKQDRNLSFADFSFGFAPPKGVGLAVNGDVVSGGGFLLLDPDQGRYAGILHLDLGGGVALKAIGLLDTRLPGGQKGFSLLAIVTVEGFKSIPLGFGFFLSGVGGLIGIHRTILQDPLLAGVRNHTLDHILFAEDPIRNAPALIATVGAVFPPSRGRHLLCLMIQATFGKPALLHINLALGVEFHGGFRISKFFVMGQIKSLLPDKNRDLIRLHMDVAGVIDFEQKTAAFDAALFDSRLARTFTISGQMALRARSGNSPNFALAIGGFHPDFNAPTGFPKLQRVSINLCEGENPRIRCEAYLALTSNTTQFGAKVEVFAKVSKFSVQGYTLFDVLVQHDPLQFNAAYESMVQLKAGSTNLFMIRLRGQLIGPSPMHISGKATFGILWWDYTVSFDKTLARGERPPLPAPVDAGVLLLDALRDRGNWSHELSATDRALVTVREPEPGDEIVIHPLSTLSVRQRVLPLDREIARFGSARPSGARQFHLTEPRVNGQLMEPTAVSEYFAPAQFFDVPDDQKLSGPSFELMTAGIRLGAGRVAFGAPVAADLGYEEIIVDSSATPEPAPPAPPARLDAQSLFVQVQWGAANQSAARHAGRAKYRAEGMAVSIAEPRFAIARTDDSVQPAAATNLSFSEAKAALRQMRRANPGAASLLQVVPQAQEVTR